MSMSTERLRSLSMGELVEIGLKRSEQDPLGDIRRKKAKYKYDYQTKDEPSPALVNGWRVAHRQDAQKLMEEFCLFMSKMRVIEDPASTDSDKGFTSS